MVSNCQKTNHKGPRLDFIHTPKKRTVTRILQATGLADTAYFQNYHRVLNRASGLSLEVSKILWQLLVTTFVKEQPLVLGADETLERRRGAKIALDFSRGWWFGCPEISFFTLWRIFYVTLLECEILSP
jgi:hypothetical protein